MSNETDDPDETTTELPETGTRVAGNGAPNGAPSSDQSAGKSFHKKRRKHGHGSGAVAPRPSDPPEVPAGAAQEAARKTAEEPAEEPSATSAPEADVAPELPDPAPRDPSEPSPAQSPQAAEPPPEYDDLRLRMKVWTDPRTGRRYLMPTAFMRDVVNGQPVSDVMRAYAMRDDDTKLVTLTASEWNALPFFYFRQDGPAPRATARQPDVIQ